MHRLLLVLLLIAPASARADVFRYASALRSSAPLPARYAGPLPEVLEPDPSHANWRPRLDWVPDGPTHLQHRLCRESSPEQERLLRAMRRDLSDGVERTTAHRYSLAFLGCALSPGYEARCDWLRRSAREEPSGPVRELLLWLLLECTDADDEALFSAEDVPDDLAVAFFRKHAAVGYSARLERIVRERAAHNEGTLSTALEPYARRDDPRVAATLLELHTAALAPHVRTVLALALRHQTDAEAREVYAAAALAHCREPGRTAPRQGPDGRLQVLGYVVQAPGCPIPAPRSASPPRVERLVPPGPGGPRRAARLRVALTRFGLDQGLLRFAPDGAGSLGSHAPMLRRMADLVRPELDALVLEEVWPALDSFRFERGAAQTYARALGDSYRVSVAELDGLADPAEIRRLEEELRAALGEPHFVDAWLDGERFRFSLPPPGRTYDVETLVGVMNTLLEAGGSKQRFVALEPFDAVVVLAGPASQIREAMEGGAIRPASFEAPRSVW